MNSQEKKQVKDIIKELDILFNELEGRADDLEENFTEHKHLDKIREEAEIIEQAKDTLEEVLNIE